jgi:hypothetical protein
MANQKALDQEFLKTRLRPSEYISYIEECLEWLITHGDTATKNQIDAKKVLMDGCFKILAKSLPDLRAIENLPEREAPVKFVFQMGDGTKVPSDVVKAKLEADEAEHPRFLFQ